ncbi:MAG: 3-phosphoshikimate 1-carboxyvinyltransferase [Cyclobacteriaceae bacterium]
MHYLLNKYNDRLTGEVRVSPSKSESNRALLIKALCSGKIGLKNLSDAQDTRTMNVLLQKNRKVWDVLDAGTTMRFLTAYLAIGGKEVTITGSDRMKERPIGHLVDALREIGSEIDYLEKEGYPPLLIKGLKTQKSNKISIPGNISSQFISALLMIGPALPKGLQIELTSEVFSKPYIEMTRDLMKAFGVETKWNKNLLSAKKAEYLAGDYAISEYTIEGDWSGVSYWYSFMALSDDEKSSITIPRLRTYSSQGDKRIAEIMFQFGIVTEFENGKIRLTKMDFEAKPVKLDMRDCPDLAQTIMVVAAARQVLVDFTGLESLKIKETDRILAMKTELKKIGADLIEKGNTWQLVPALILPKSVEIDTYEDHRMAMAFAPLCMQMDVVIREPSVVRKSYPGFWEEIKKVGVKISPH